jgi:mono/diheme cytochrome c family protein
MEVAVLTKTAFFFAAAVLFALASWAQTRASKSAPDYKIPPEEVARANPVKPTAESLAKARKTYAIDCAMCHGEKGDGKGDLASDMKNVTDFTNPDSLKDSTDGELAYIIKNGKGDMPPEGPRGTSDDFWNLVNYIRAFAKK